jgi:O-antigen ligase
MPPHEMNDARAPGAAARILPAAVLGAYAAAIALAPKPAGMLVLAAPLAIVPAAWWALGHARRWPMLFFAAAILLPPLPLGIGDSGPHPSLLLVGLGLLAGVWAWGEWHIPVTRLNCALALFFVILLGSVAEAVFFSGSTVGLASLARVLLLGISLYVFFYTAYGPGAREPSDVFRDTRLLFWLAAAAALFACVDFYFQFPPPAGFGPQFIWLRSGVYRRAQGLFYEASTLGNFCALFLAMVATALLAHIRRAPVSRTGLLGGGLLLASALVLSFSRGSLLNLLVAIAVLIRLRRPEVRLGRFFLALAGAVLAGALVLRALLPAFTEAYWMRLSASVEYSFSETEGLLSGRVASWRAVIGFLSEHPWHALFGIGYKTLPYSTYLGRTVITDNMYLSLLAETGVVGLAAMLWMCVEIVRAARRAAASRDPRQSFFGSWMLAFWIGQMVQMCTGDLLTYWRVAPLYLWVLAMAVRREHPVS